MPYARNTASYIKELLKGKVQKNDIKFPIDLGEEHPFDYSKVERLVKKFGVLSAIIDKHVDFMLSGGIIIKSEDERGQDIIEEFMRDYDFDTNMRIWLRQGFMLGFSPMELSYDSFDTIDGMKMLKSDSVYVKRNDFGVVEGFKQYTKQFGTYVGKDDTKFDTNEIADLNLNVYGDEYYGLGLIYPVMGLIDNLIGSNKEMHTIMARKANSPLIMIGGDKTANNGRGEYPTKGEMDDMGQAMEWMNNKHEWTLTDFWKPTTVDFGNIGDKFEFVIENDLDLLYTAVQIPAVIMGKANVPEGLAKVQMRAWELRIQSLREHVEKVIERKIFRPVLIANGIDVHVEVEWGLPSQEEKDAKAGVLIEAMKNPMISSKLFAQLELQFASLFDIAQEDVETSDEERKKEEEDQKQPRVPGSNAANPSKTPTPIKKESCDCSSSTEEIYSTEELERLDNCTLQEFVGFNYKEYENDVLVAVNIDKFEQLKGMSKTELRAGLLSSNEIDKLRTTMYEGFDNNKSVGDMARELKKRITFKDRFVVKNGKFKLNKQGLKILSVSAKNRPIMIARSEVIRLSNIGAVNNYMKNGILQSRWVSANSERTCEQCSGLNGEIFNNATNTTLPPLHPMCRCSLAPVVK